MQFHCLSFCLQSKVMDPFSFPLIILGKKLPPLALQWESKSEQTFFNNSLLLKVHITVPLFPNGRGSLVWYMDGPKTNEDTGAGVYKWGSKRGHSFQLRLHTTVFLVEVYVIVACIMGNI